MLFFEQQPRLRRVLSRAFCGVLVFTLLFQISYLNKIVHTIYVEDVITNFLSMRDPATSRDKWGHHLRINHQFCSLHIRKELFLPQSGTQME